MVNTQIRSCPSTFCLRTHVHQKPVQKVLSQLKFVFILAFNRSDCIVVFMSTTALSLSGKWIHWNFAVIDHVKRWTNWLFPFRPVNIVDSDNDQYKFPNNMHIRDLNFIWTVCFDGHLAPLNWVKCWNWTISTIAENIFTLLLTDLWMKLSPKSIAEIKLHFRYDVSFEQNHL